MGTRHWPEDADDYFEKLRTTITEKDARIAQLEEALKDSLVLLEWYYDTYADSCASMTIYKINEVIGS